MFGWKFTRDLYFRFIPSHINDPVGLVKRLLFSGDQSARFTIFITGLGVLLTPVDWILSKLERFAQHSDSNDRGSKNAGPHIFVCGPARSGTTLLYQVLADNLDVAYTRNLALMFPRSVRTMVKLSSRISSKREYSQTGYQNYYGKTYGFSAPSEANFLWNQWVEPDESSFRTIISDSGADRCARYYRYLAGLNALPTLAKNNNVNVFASKIFEALPNSYFICLKRDTQYLAQSLIRARLEINGDLNQTYGVVNARHTANTSNPYIQVIEQIEYLNQTAEEQQKLIGTNNFWIVEYEEFCSNPSDLVNRIRKEILNREPVSDAIPAIRSTNKVVDKNIFAKITEALQQRLSNAAPYKSVETVSARQAENIEP